MSQMLDFSFARALPYPSRHLSSRLQNYRNLRAVFGHTAYLDSFLIGLNHGTAADDEHSSCCIALLFHTLRGFANSDAREDQQHFAWVGETNDLRVEKFALTFCETARGQKCDTSAGVSRSFRKFNNIHGMGNLRMKFTSRACWHSSARWNDNRAGGKLHCKIDHPGIRQITGNNP